MTKNIWTRPQRNTASLVSLLIILIVSSITLIFLSSEGRANALPFDSPLPERKKTKEPGKPATWVRSGDGDSRIFGAVTVLFPPGFTNQGGANVIGNMIIAPVGIEDSERMLPGTEIALGIWPGNEQTVYQQPIELRFSLNAAQIPVASASTLIIAQFNPVLDSWIPLSTEFLPATYQLRTSVQTFTPVAREFPNWGGRTFFAVLRGGNNAKSALASLPTTVRSAANLRAGPGINYPVVEVAQKGDIVTPIATNASGYWVQLADGMWIAGHLLQNTPQVPIVGLTSVPNHSSSIASTRTPISTAASTRTPEPARQTAAAIIPDILEINAMSLGINKLADIDDGRIGNLIKADIWYVAGEEEDAHLLMINGAGYSWPGSNVSGYGVCADADYATTPIPIETIASNDYLCVRTDQGRYALLRFTDVSSGDSLTLSFVYTLWSNQ